MATQPASDERILSVGEITRAIKETLADSFPAVWVRGEMSGLKQPDSGHLYFSLKEGRDAVIACAMWKPQASRLMFEPRDGAEVEVFGGVDVYAPRGNYQLIVRQMRPAGIGALLLALEELKQRLAAEGLFDAARKRALPRYPRRIGLVTSPVGAAVKDLVTVLRSRWPSIEIVLAPVRVQGEGAAAEIAAAIERFGRYGNVDLLIVGRGGGSLEDLWAFNEEPVVRALAASRIPTISAVGHEVDTTLADLAADVRAATPSNAAELAVRDAREVARTVTAARQRLDRAVLQVVRERRRRLERLLEKYGFRRQRDLILAFQQRVDDQLERLTGAIRARVEQLRERLAAVRSRYGLREWPRRIGERRQQLAGTRQRLDDGVVEVIHARRRRVQGLGDRLRALSPRLVLERGYCLARSPDGRLLRLASELAVGDSLTIEFARGEADARISAVRPGEPDGR
ncbi:MAG: exodeoxyribonuclease VII large subunit [Candidatus Eisenbacteria bacterium]|uniref:Exodeoxyribonuclease 7 large subunit n=1 Tax=Eiseniibacteriota bacterium TaxID=2212470 RepID=A0A849SVY4_UNCEI|nr:exodeoxyribonuclease VII large subunit [Candidatus Eisenbacteria bacterium]